HQARTGLRLRVWWRVGVGGRALRDDLAFGPHVRERGVRTCPDARRPRRQGGAIRVLDSVPNVSSRFISAQVATIACAVRGRAPASMTEAEITVAARRLEALQLDSVRHGLLAVEVLGAAQSYVRARRPVSAGATVLG